MLIATHIAAAIGGAVAWHFYATKVLGYAKQAVQSVQNKL